MGEDPMLTRGTADERKYISNGMLKPTTNGGTSPLPWYAVFRVPLSQLVTLGTLLISLTVAYYKVQAHETEITNIKAAMQTKDGSVSDQRLLFQRIDDLEKNVNRRLDDLKEDIKDARRRR